MQPKRSIVLLAFGLVLTITIGPHRPIGSVDGANVAQTAAAAAAAAAQQSEQQEVQQGDGGGGGVVVVGQRRAMFMSELRLWSVVEKANSELRQLKREFMQSMSDTYLQLKLDTTIGYEQAYNSKSASIASANVLIAEEFATAVIKKHIIQRRLFTGLKLAFTKLLPMPVLLKLYSRYKSFEWLKDQEQVDLRPKFSGATENDFVNLYSLIELRARVRAAEDVIALTSDNIKRVLEVVHWYLVESNHDNQVSGEELGALAHNAKLVLQYYWNDVFEWNSKWHRVYEKFVKKAAPLAELIGGQEQLIGFIDRFIDVEALDIDLNSEAKSFEHPPTITEQMIINVQKRWIPWYVLKSLEEDRKVLIENRRQVMHLVYEPAHRNADLQEWTSNLLDYLCHNSVVHPK